MKTKYEISQQDTIGIIAGSGNLPGEIIKSCINLGKKIFVIYLQGSSHETESLQYVPHIKLNIGSVGKAIRTFQAEGVKYIVMVGAIKRPKFSSLIPDATGIKLLTRISAAKLSGDNSLLTIVIQFFESFGFTIIGVDSLLQEILMPFGKLGKISPGKKSLEDIQLGIGVAKAIGDMDIGQGVVIQNGVVLGVEAIEGTDALLERCRNLKLEGPGGVLVKMKKPSQDTRIDLPTIGPDTIQNAYNAGLSGIAAEAGSAIIVDREKVTALADKLNMFVIGV